MKRMKQSKKALQNNGWYFLMLLVPFAWYVFVFLKPMIEGIALSFYQWDGLSADKTFIGIQNYITLFTKTPKFWTSFFNSIQYVLYVVIGCLILSLTIALLIHKKSKINNTFRALFYLPCVLSTTAIAFMWTNAVYSPNIGILNTVLEKLGLDFLTHVWLGEADIIINSIGTVEIYLNLGMAVLLFITGLQDIPGDVLEAAKIDGANAVQLFVRVTLPLLKSTISLVTVIVMIAAMRSFDLMYIMSGKTTTVLATLLYEEMFSYRRVGTGSATAVVLFMVVIVFNIVQKLVIREDS